jgi:hypothetical protein
MDTLKAGLLGGPPDPIRLFIPHIRSSLPHIHKIVRHSVFSFTLKKEAVDYSEMLVPICHTIWLHSKSNCILYLHTFIACSFIIKYYSKFYNSDAI